jgi:hypothetical protein
MCTGTAPASMAEALGKIEALAGFVADLDATQLPAAVLAEGLTEMERIDAVLAVARGQLVAAFDAKDGHLADGQRTTRTWFVHVLRVTKGQAAYYLALRELARGHPVLRAALRDLAVTAPVALQLAKWTRMIPAEFRGTAEEILVLAARAGADLRALAEICAEIRYRTAPPDPGDQDGKHLDRGLSLETTFEGAGVLHGDLTPECSALVAAVLDALSAPAGAGDLRTRPQRYHDALAEAMKRLLASDLLPARAGQPTKALVHIGFPDLCQLDTDSALQDKWIQEYRARWAAHRAAASVGPGDGGAWLDGDAARRVACDSMVIPVVLGDIDPGAIDQLIELCVLYDRTRAGAAAEPTSPATGPDGQTGVQDGQATRRDGQATGHDGQTTGQDRKQDGQTGGPDGPDATDGADAGDDAAVPAGQHGSTAPEAEQAGRPAEVLAMLEHQILAAVISVVSGPGGVASFLRRNLLGKPLGGPSLPLDVGQTDEIPVHLRRLVALRDQGCQFPGGCDQPAAACEPHHVVHRADGGHTSLTGLKHWCWWHHHVVLHQMGWALTVYPDGTSQVRSPAGKTIRSHSPPPRPG